MSAKTFSVEERREKSAHAKIMYVYVLERKECI